jgi:hypothetical protein
VIQVAAEAAAPLAVVWMVATPVESIITGLLKMLPIRQIFGRDGFFVQHTRGAFEHSC